MKATRLVSVMMVSLVFSACAFAQPPAIEWSRTYGGIYSDICFDLDITSDGGYVLAGETWSFGAGDGDFWLVKTNTDGDSLWSRTFGGYCWEGCENIQQTADGGFILGGVQCSFGAQRWDGWIVRTSPNGDSLWSRSYGGPRDDYIFSIRQAPDIGYFVVGEATWYDSSGSQAFLMKLDSNGDSVWSRSFRYTDAISVNPLGNGDCIIAGSRISARTGMAAFWLYKTDENGDSIWSRIYDRDSSWCTCHSMCQASDGSYILAGTSSSYITDDGGGDFWMVKTDADGDSLWSQILGTTISVESCNAVWPTADGGYILGGYTQNLSTETNADLWIVRIDASGNEMWNLTFGGEGWEEAFAVQQTMDGGFVIGGWTESFGAGADDFLLIKIAPEMSAPNILVPQKMCFLSNYPNPFNTTTVLQFAVPRTSQVMIRAYDVLGREVGTIADAVYSTGEYSISWQCPDCASGVYWIRMSGDGFNRVRKTILLR